jgi:hypothetical protein
MGPYRGTPRQAVETPNNRRQIGVQSRSGGRLIDHEVGDKPEVGKMIEVANRHAVHLALPLR